MARWKLAVGSIFIAYLVAGALVYALTGSVEYGFLVICGPFAGGIVREWQSCCAANSSELAPAGYLCIASGIGLGFVPRLKRRWLEILRKVALSSLWAGWFVVALLSYGHALE